MTAAVSNALTESSDRVLGSLHLHFAARCTDLKHEAISKRHRLYCAENIAANCICSLESRLDMSDLAVSGILTRTLSDCFGASVANYQFHRQHLDRRESVGIVYRRCWSSSANCGWKRKRPPISHRTSHCPVIRTSFATFCSMTGSSMASLALPAKNTWMFQRRFTGLRSSGVSMLTSCLGGLTGVGTIWVVSPTFYFLIVFLLASWLWSLQRRAGSACAPFAFSYGSVRWSNAIGRGSSSNCESQVGKSYYTLFWGPCECLSTHINSAGVVLEFSRLVNAQKTAS